MNAFDNVKEDFEHRFVRQDPKMLKNMFGAEELTSFWLADMDFKIAPPITEELERIVNRGVYAYEFATREVFDAIVDWNITRHRLNLNPKSFVQVSGVLTGISLLIREFTQPDDAILIQTPVYQQFAQIIKSNGRKIITNPLQIINGNYEMDFEDLEQKLHTHKVKIILLCNPHNPVGRVWREEELQTLLEAANRYNVTIISDEIHGDIIYSGHQFKSLMSLQADKHISLIGSPAKTFGMQSISNGYIYIPDEVRLRQIKKTVGAMYLNHGNTFTTFATIAAFKHGEAWLDELLNYLEKNISWIQSFLHEELPMIKMYPVEGTYQIWLDFRTMSLNQKELTQLLTQQAKLALTPGSWFDRQSPLFMRMNIAAPLTKIKTAFQQLSIVVNQNL